MSVASSSADGWVTHPWVAEAQGRIRFSAAAMGRNDDWPALLRLVRLAEEVGFDSFGITDHPARKMGCFTTLAALAVATRRIRLMTIVNCVYYLPPAQLARMAADVDRLSEGRLVLGLGIGWMADEFEQLAIPFPPVPERQQALEEVVHILRGLWSGEPFSYAGRHFRINNARFATLPVQQPRIPLLIAGGGERVTLRQVAQYADLSNFGPTVSTGSAFTLEDVRRKLAALRRHCEALGRPFDSVGRSYAEAPVILAPTEAALAERLGELPPATLERYRPSMFAGTPEQAIAHYRTLAAAGIQDMGVVVQEWDEETIRLVGERVIPALAAG